MPFHLPHAGSGHAAAATITTSTGTVAYIPYLYDTEVNEDGSVLSGKIGIEYVDAPNIFPVTWKNGEVSECIFAFG